ncbi:MAG: peptidoglycan editing factor PgeF [Alphaproteobacteria bacterium]|nr:peptidoglycan editing factor PgeF [Alphaproteobacteria bacterium]
MILPHLTHPSFQFDKIKYGYFTRAGGVSDNSFASLNCGPGSGDLLDNVHENHRRIAAEFNLDSSNLLFCKQIHSDKVVTATTPWQRHLRPEADAMVTKEKGIALAVMSADCVPILFYDSTNHIIGAAHSGWKGAIGGIIEATINAMEQIGGSAKTIHACIGPCIRQDSYEVSDEFYDTFVQEAAANKVLFKPSVRDGHVMFDLAGYVRGRLIMRGIEHVSDIGADTQSDEAHFFSYRRRTLRDELQNGIQMSVIALC